MKVPLRLLLVMAAALTLGACERVPRNPLTASGGDLTTEAGTQTTEPPASGTVTDPETPSEEGPVDFWPLVEGAVFTYDRTSYESITGTGTQRQTVVDTFQRVERGASDATASVRSAVFELDGREASSMDLRYIRKSDGMYLHNRTYDHVWLGLPLPAVAQTRVLKPASTESYTVSEMGRTVDFRVTHEDEGMTLALGKTVVTPAGVFSGCLEVTTRATSTLRQTDRATGEVTETRSETVIAIWHAPNLGRVKSQSRTTLLNLTTSKFEEMTDVSLLATYSMPVHAL